MEAQNCTGVTGESSLPITIRHPVIVGVHLIGRVYDRVCSTRVTCYKVPSLLQCVTRITQYIAVCTVQTPGCGTSGSIVAAGTQYEG